MKLYPSSSPHTPARRRFSTSPTKNTATHFATLFNLMSSKPNMRILSLTHGRSMPSIFLFGLINEIFPNSLSPDFSLGRDSMNLAKLSDVLTLNDERESKRKHQPPRSSLIIKNARALSSDTHSLDELLRLQKINNKTWVINFPLEGSTKQQVINDYNIDLTNFDLVIETKLERDVAREKYLNINILYNKADIHNFKGSDFQIEEITSRLIRARLDSHAASDFFIQKGLNPKSDILNTLKVGFIDNTNINLSYPIEEFKRLKNSKYIVYPQYGYNKSNDAYEIAFFHCRDITKNKHIPIRLNNFTVSEIMPFGFIPGHTNHAKSLYLVSGHNDVLRSFEKNDNENYLQVVGKDPSSRVFQNKKEIVIDLKDQAKLESMYTERLARQIKSIDPSIIIRGRDVDTALEVIMEENRYGLNDRLIKNAENIIKESGYFSTEFLMKELIISYDLARELVLLLKMKLQYKGRENTKDEEMRFIVDRNSYLQVPLDQATPFQKRQIERDQKRFERGMESKKIALKEKFRNLQLSEGELQNFSKVKQDLYRARLNSSKAKSLSEEEVDRIRRDIHAKYQDIALITPDKRE